MHLPEPPPVPGLTTALLVTRGPGVHDDAAVNAHARLPIASVGKLLLLLEVARRLADGTLDPTLPLDRRTVAPVADSGLWQYLSVDVLSVVDVAALVGATSDNLATNVLIDLVGLDAVAECAASLGLRETALLDIVRDVRDPARPGVAPTLAYGSASELARVVGGLRADAWFSPPVCAQVRTWLGRNADLSMVAGGFGLDPLAHDTGSVSLWNKTGTDAGVRVDVGSARWSDGVWVDYAVLAHWPPDAEASARSAVLAWMREVGQRIAR